MRPANVRIVLALVALMGAPNAASPQLVDGCPTHTYLGNLPSDAESPDWSEQAQGIANDGEHWFFTNVSHLFKYSANWRHGDGDDSGKLASVGFPSVLADLGIDHFGDPDHHGGYVFVPFEHSPPLVCPPLICSYDPPYAVIAVFSASDLAFVDWIDVTDFQEKAGWLAIDPVNGHLYTSVSTIESGTPLLRYDLDLAKIGKDDEEFLTLPPTEVPLEDLDGGSIEGKFTYLQGGVFSPWGDLYLVAGKAGESAADTRGGIHLFRKPKDSEAFRLKESSVNASSPAGTPVFAYEYHPGSTELGEEPEGIDWWDRDGVTDSRYRGQLHAILLDNQADDDNIWLKHYRVHYDCVADTDDSGYHVPDVIGQFDALALRPEALGFGIGSSPDPSTCRHYQGMARSEGPGTPYLFVTRSGNDPGAVAPCPPSDVDGPGNLLVVRLGSRDTTGERLRSNRLVRDLHIVFTAPEPRDAVETWISFDGTGCPGDACLPPYQHPGGVQLLDGVLAVPLDTRLDSSWPEYLVAFLDVSTPTAPRLASHFAPVRADGSPANTSVVGLARVANPEGAGHRYLMISTGGDNSRVTFWRSLPTRTDGTTDLTDPNLTWEPVGRFTEDQIEACLGGHDWPTGLQDPYQMMNLVREGGLRGDLFLIGATNTLLADDDRLDLHRVNVDDFGIPGACPFLRIARKHVTSEPIMGGGASANFAAASGVYVSPSGELIVYGTEHENDGPSFVDTSGTVTRQSVRFAEWRHREIVRPSSPTLRPSVDLPGVLAVDEGGVLPLDGEARGPLTRAWLQLFEDEGLGSSLPDFFETDRWLMLDWEDWGKDDFDQFGFFNFNDQADSMRWFAPAGCAIRLNQHAFGDDDFPGERSRVLEGTGIAQAVSSLDGLDFGDAMSSAEFSPFAPDGNTPQPSCDDYYAAPIAVAWDLDADGTFETTGAAEFSATELDGPDEHVLHARAQHPTDPTALGQSQPATVRVNVRNVAPTIVELVLRDHLGTPVPFGLLGLEYVATARFTDPGKADRQTATLDWGDGTAASSADFDVFSDAFGGATGELAHSHVFVAPGSRTVDLRIADDDGGESEATRTFAVLTPAEALQILLDEVDLLLASATLPKVLKALREARAQLDGYNNGTATDGAIDKLDENDPLSAVVKLAAFVSTLFSAEAAGTGDLGTLRYTAVFVAEAIAQAEYVRVVEALPNPSSGQARQLARIAEIIAAGRLELATGDPLGAIDLYRDAVSRAVRLVS